jgi:hypothetical protein
MKEEPPHCEAIRKMFSNLQKKFCRRFPRKLDPFDLVFCIIKYDQRRRIQEEDVGFFYSDLKIWSSGPGQRRLALPEKYCNRSQNSGVRKQKKGCAFGAAII